MALKNGASFTATGMRTLAFTCRTRSTYICSTRAPALSRVGGEVVDVQLQGVGAGLLRSCLAYSIQPPGETPLRLAMTGIAHRLLAPCGCAPGSRPARGCSSSCRGSSCSASAKLSVPCSRHWSQRPALSQLDLLLEQRVQHDGRGAGVLHRRTLSEVLAQRRGASRPAGSSASVRGRSWYRSIIPTSPLPAMARVGAPLPPLHRHAGQLLIQLPALRARPPAPASSSSLGRLRIALRPACVKRVSLYMYFSSGMRRRLASRAAAGSCPAAARRGS